MYLFLFSVFINDLEKEMIASCCNSLELQDLRWYGTPCNIFKDDRILKNDYNLSFKNFKIYNICPQNAFIKFHKRDKK